jgi:prevent-host-death family protein
MTRFSVVEAKANFSRLLAEVEAGRDVVITRRGIAVAKISGVAPKKVPPNMKGIAAFRSGLKPGEMTASDLVRRVRDERY